MSEASIIDDFLRVIYIDPLIEQATTDFKSDSQIWDVIEGDFLVHPYIQMLNEEIYSDPPSSFSDNEIALWEEDNLSAMLTQFMDGVRGLRWAVVQFYEGNPSWRIFTKIELQAWIKDNDNNIIGGKFTVSSINGIATEECIFGENQCYMIKWKEGRKDIFAYSDISLAMWTSATVARQIRNQLDVMGAKPEFPWVTYGDNVTPAQRVAIMDALDNASITNGIGATENAVKGMTMIPHTLYDELMALVDRKSKGFASLSRLPFAFYNGERESQGFGEKGELIVEMQIDKKKQHIFNKSKPIIRQIYMDRYNITLTDIEMDVNEVEIQETPEVEIDAE